MDKRIKDAMKRGEFIHGLDLPDEVLLHNLKISNAEMGITEEDIDSYDDSGEE